MGTDPVPPQEDGAASPYAAWSLGPPTDPDWFPIGVWLQDPKLAERYGAIGINTFVGLWKGPTEEQLELLRAADMKVVCGLNDVGRRHRRDANIIAWMQVDEPDNRGDGPGPRVTPEEVQERYEWLRRRDPERPVWLNLGQGVANDSWVGLGARRSDYPAYVAATDIVSFDVYPVTNIRRSDGENYLWYVPKGVRRLRKWGSDEKIVWTLVECTRGSQREKKPTPSQVRSEVWMSLIAGSRGIVYFCHEFDPKVSPAALLLDEEMAAAVGRINAEVLRLAPVLNGPSLRGVRIASEDPDVPVDAMMKEHDGALYLFAVGMRNAPTRATFTFEGLQTADVRVLGERRRLRIEDGELRDDFAPYEVHLYRIEP